MEKKGVGESREVVAVDAVIFDSIPPVALPEPALQGTLDDPTLPHTAARGRHTRARGAAGSATGDAREGTAGGAAQKVL